MPGPTHSAAPSDRTRRLIARLVLASGLLAMSLVVAPPPAADAYWTPPPPVGDYTPRHVWQRKNDCVWAAGQMLLDKWTHGAIRVSQGRLRQAARDRKGGSSLFDLARGVRRATGIRLSFSPGYGDTMTWWQLLDRLEHDGGAVLLGEYARLPRRYTRWSPRFASLRDTGHAVYVERYDRAHARVWLMDPLASGDFPGEWIGVEALHRYASFDHGRVLAAATPPRHRPTTAPLIDQAYRLGRPVLGGTPAAGSRIIVRVGLTIKSGFPTPAAHRFIAAWDPILVQTAGIGVSARVVIDSRAPGTESGPEPTAARTTSAPGRPDRRGFVATIPVPAVPGRYRLSLGLGEPGGRTSERMLAPLEVEVLPAFAAAWQAPAVLDATTGQPLTFELGLTNVGTFDWRPANRQAEGTRGSGPRRPQTLLVMTWRSSSGQAIPAGDLAVELAPGERIQRSLRVSAPPDAGAWTLVLDVVSVERGPLSVTGRDVPEIAVSVSPMGLAAEP